MQGTIILGLIFAIIVAIFALQNATIVALNILIWNFEISLAVVVLVSIIFGALVIGIFSYFKQFQLKRENKKLRLEKEELQQKLNNLREETQKAQYYNTLDQNNDEPDKEAEENQKEKRGFFNKRKKKSADDDKQDIAYDLKEDDQDEDLGNGNDKFQDVDTENEKDNNKSN